MKTLILGIGNYLMGDEGVGIHVVRMLEKTGMPGGVDLLDGGTGGFQLLNELQQYPHVIIIDASLDQHPEGHIRCISPRYPSDFPPSLSAHDIGLKDMIEALILLDDMPTITLVAISVKDLSRLSIELSPAIQRAAKESIKVIQSLTTM